MKGAEAIVKLGKLIGKKVVIKDRIPKKYRIEEIDQKLRKERTKKEARLLHKAKLSGVKCPTVLEVEEFRLVLELLPGKRKMNKDIEQGRRGKKLETILSNLSEEGRANLVWSMIQRGESIPQHQIEKTIDYHIQQSLRFSGHDSSGYIVAELAKAAGNIQGTLNKIESKEEKEYNE